jgi:hypothetical protein
MSNPFPYALQSLDALRRPVVCAGLETPAMGGKQSLQQPPKESSSKVVG